MSPNPRKPSAGPSSSSRGAPTPPPRFRSGLEALIASAPALLFHLSAEGRYLYASRPVRSGSTDAETGKLIEQVLSAEQAAGLRALMRRVEDSGRPRSAELVALDALGRPRRYVVMLAPFLVHGRFEGYVGVGLAAVLEEESPADPGAAGLAARLTPKQREVLVLVAEGLSSREIGQRLGVSERTVETHRQQLMDRLDIRGVAALARFALSAGLL